MTIFDEKTTNYLRAHSSQEPELLTKLREETQAHMHHPQMLSGPVLGRLLKLLAQLSHAKRILEIGTFTGYATLWMAEALPEDGELITCEINPEAQAIAQKYFDQSKVGRRIAIRMGDALQTVASVEGPFDFSFIDADKTQYPEAYEAVLEKTRPGGLLVFDNTLWSGRVLEPSDNDTRAIDTLNKQVTSDPRVENLLLSVGDGIQVIRKL